jgi:hypothetical protein
MKRDELRQALSELDGDRDATIAFRGLVQGPAVLTVARAMLVPDEPDHLLKVTDGQAIYILDAESIAWIRIGLNQTLETPSR